MDENEKQFEQDFERHVSPAFVEDLKALYQPGSQVPTELDRAILARAQRQFAPRRDGSFSRFRWAAAIAAAAAVVIFVFTLETPKRLETQPSKIMAVAAADIDASGRVDILDAFQLAKRIESSEKFQMKWDLNRDGNINRDDVEFVALAAVSLDKGVL